MQSWAGGAWVGAGKWLASIAWIAMGVIAVGCGKVDRGPQLTSDTRPEVSRRESSSSQLGLVPKPTERRQTNTSPTSLGLHFVDVTSKQALLFEYQNGTSGKQLMVEPTGGGVGWLDYDRDGRWDVFVNQGGDPAAPNRENQPSDQLFRQRTDGSFENVTVAAHVAERGYSQGVAIGDFDNDGFADLFITNVGPNSLFRNQGDGTFQPIAEALWTNDRRWSSSAAWGDIDLDGDLDLYVCRYVDFDPLHPIECHNAKGQKTMCQPNEVAAVPDECYLNEGDGSFRPVAAERGLFGPGNKALGVAIADFNNDGWPDIYVANDATPNFLFLNDKTGHFRELAATLGCAVTLDGRSQASMGVAVGDYDRNGHLDLYLTHFEGEWNTLYQNLGEAGFHDVTARVGLVKPTLPWVGFGTFMADFNQDGAEDIFVSNGHLDDPGYLGTDPKMPPQLFTFVGPRWQEVSETAGDYFHGRYVGRGVAAADYDNDGDWDLAVIHQNARMALLRNDSPRGHWLKIGFRGRIANREGIGTRVTVRYGTQQILQELAAGTSYCSAHQPCLIFGFGDWSEPVDLEIRWPGRVVEIQRGIAVNQTLILDEPCSLQIKGRSQ